MKNSNETPGLVVAIGDRPDSKQGGGNLDAMSQAANVDTVPLDALSMPDDQEQMHPPEVGDVVNYQVTGKVVSIEGGVAKVQKTSINGQDIGADDDNDGQNPDNDDDDAQGLRDQAGGLGMMMSIILFLILIATPVFGQNSTLFCSSPVLTNQLTVLKTPGRLYSIEGYSVTNVPIYVHVFLHKGNQLPWKIATNSTIYSNVVVVSGVTNPIAVNGIYTNYSTNLVGDVNQEFWGTNSFSGPNGYQIGVIHDALATTNWAVFDFSGGAVQDEPFRNSGALTNYTFPPEGNWTAVSAPSTNGLTLKYYSSYTNFTYTTNQPAELMQKVDPNSSFSFSFGSGANVDFCYVAGSLTNAFTGFVTPCLSITAVKDNR